MNEQQPAGDGCGNVTPDRTEASESAPGRILHGAWGDVLARGIAARVRLLIVHVRELQRAADTDASTEDRARTLTALVEVDERIEKLLLRLEPWRSDTETAD